MLVHIDSDAFPAGNENIELVIRSFAQEMPVVDTDQFLFHWYQPS